MGNNITLLSDGATFKDMVDDCGGYEISILNNEELVGNISGFVSEEEVHIELIKIEEEFQNKGLGTLAIQTLMLLGKEYGLKYIHGECKRSLMKFYKRFGADFSCREPEDSDYILEKFYIDL